MKERERILAFDRELLSVDDSKALASKLLCILMSMLGCFMMLIPVGAQESADMRAIYVIPWIFLGIAVTCRMQPYVYVGNLVRVAEILAYAPVDKGLLLQVRRSYLRRYLAKLGAAAFLFQQFGALIEGCWSVWNLLYPAGIILLLYLAGVAYIGRKG